MGYGSAVALGRALEYVNELGVDRVLAHDQALAARLADGLRSLGPRSSHRRTTRIAAASSPRATRGGTARRSPGS